MYCLYSENEVVNFFNDDLYDKKIAMLDLYEKKIKGLNNNQYILYDLTIENDAQMTANVKKEKNIYYTIMNKRGGLLPCWHGQRTKGSQRICVHDALLNACSQFVIYVKKEVLYRELPVQSNVNAQIKKVMDCASIQDTKLFFQGIVIRHYLGGLENYIREQEKGVFICLANIEATDGINKEDHCFVWNEKYYDIYREKHYPDIIDNWENIPIQLMEEEDVKDIDAFRASLVKIFQGICCIRAIYRVYEGTMVIG